MQHCNLLLGSCRPKLGMYCSASQLSMSFLVQLGSFRHKIGFAAAAAAAAPELCSLMLMHFCLRQLLILLFWAARHNDAEMQQEHDPLCGCMATAATKERCAALGPGRIQCAVAD